MYKNNYETTVKNPVYYDFELVSFEKGKVDGGNFKSMNSAELEAKTNKMYEPGKYIICCEELNQFKIIEVTI